MTKQWLVICYRHRTEVWNAYDDDSVIVNPDVAFIIDGTLHVYRYERGEDAELESNWLERCAIEARYHARNQGAYILPVHVTLNQHKAPVYESKMILPFDEEES